MQNEMMGKPFSIIFQNRNEALWAFSWLKDTLSQLGIKAYDDPKMAITIRRSNDKRRALRLNYGTWRIVGFRSPELAGDRIELALLDGIPELEIFREHGPFKAHESEPPISLYRLPIQLARENPDYLQGALADTLKIVTTHFASQTRSVHRYVHLPVVAEAVFDVTKREPLLRDGINFDESIIFSEGAATNNGLNTFSEETFVLLTELRETPTKEFYNNNKADLVEYVIEPVKRLFKDIADQLPPSIKEVMETKKGLTSNILKNDYGKGSAYEFYWGAFYPKNSKRIWDAQLFIGLHPDRLEFGFYVGENGTKPQERLEKNAVLYKEEVATIFTSLGLGDVAITSNHKQQSAYPQKEFDLSDTEFRWEKWLQNPRAANFRVAITMKPEEVLSCSFAELVWKISTVFTKLFPLVLLTTEDNPLPLIEAYVLQQLQPLTSGTEAQYSGYSPNVNLLKEKVEMVESPSYSLSTISEKTGLEETELARWVRAIRRKGQAILYGPPGTGKTFVATWLARHLLEQGDGIFETVQFHPAYSYEEFIQGLRPEARQDGTLEYRLVAGRFLDFCQRAREREGTSILLIDEINRANLARVFGELMYLLEYRDKTLPLAGGGELSIPPNVLILGTMNTADRSIALVDHALRRRFAFLALYPNFDVLRQYYHDADNLNINGLISILQTINTQIADRHYEVGISYFLGPDLHLHIEDIWRMEIEPYLEEYFFDQPEKVDALRWDSINANIWV